MSLLLKEKKKNKQLELFGWKEPTKCPLSFAFQVSEIVFLILFPSS